MIPRWLLPNASDICALVRMALGHNARTITHQPFETDKRATCWTKESARAARKAQIEKRAQQIALLPYDDTLGR